MVHEIITLDGRATLSRYHSIIIGAGHNGLICAAYLAKSGQNVLVLEAADTPGGMAADREFHPGFHTPIAHSIGHFSNRVVNDLNLTQHGFEPPSRSLPTICLDPDRNHVTINGKSVSGVDEDDVLAYENYSNLMNRFSTALDPFWLKTIPRIGPGRLSDLLTFAHLGLNVRRMGRKDMQEFLRIASLPARDLMDEFFENDLLKSALAWDGLIGSKMAPRSPNGALLSLLYRWSEESFGIHNLPAGGINSLISALVAAATAAGAEVRCGAEVDRVELHEGDDGLAAGGVRLANGEIIEADRVVSSADPQTTFLQLVGVRHLDIGFTNRIRRLRCDGFVAKLHLALDGVPEFTGITKPEGRMIIAPGLDSIEFAFDDAKYGDCPENPVLEILIPSLSNRSLAPDGQHVLSAHVMYVPYQHRGGWTESARSRMCERAISAIENYAPELRQHIVHQEFLTPADLEREYRVTGGHWHHTEFSMDQMLMMRPTYEAAQYETPIPGLYLCGAGCHPAGDLTGFAGHNAAREILR